MRYRSEEDDEREVLKCNWVKGIYHGLQQVCGDIGLCIFWKKTRATAR